MTPYYSEEQIEQMKQEVVSLLQSTNRLGMDRVIQYLERSDFYTAPSSTIYHNSFKGGLLAHSLNVYHAALKIIEVMKSVAIPEKKLDSITPDTIIISTILHDICKTGFYEPTSKMYKDDYGEWHKYLSYTINDHHAVPVGHGERSVVLLLMLGLQLKPAEATAIRYHMGMSDPGLYMSPYTKNSMMAAINDYPLCELLMLSDHMASFIMEKEVNQKVDNEIPLN